MDSTTLAAIIQGVAAIIGPLIVVVILHYWRQNGSKKVT